MLNQHELRHCDRCGTLAAVRPWYVCLPCVRKSGPNAAFRVDYIPSTEDRIFMEIRHNQLMDECRESYEQNDQAHELRKAVTAYNQNQNKN